MVAFDRREVPVGHKGCPGKGTGRGKVCAGSQGKVAGIVTRDDVVEALAIDGRWQQQWTEKA